MLAIIVIVNNHDQNCKNLFKFGAASCSSELTKLCQLAHESKRVNEAECIIMQQTFSDHKNIFKNKMSHIFYKYANIRLNKLIL